MTIDLRKNASQAPHADQQDVLITFSLSDYERESLRSALSDDNLKNQEWTIDKSGRIKDKDGDTVFQYGFATALRKVIDVYCA